MAEIEILSGSTPPGASPAFMPIAGEGDVVTSPAETAPLHAGPDAELLALIAEAKVALAHNDQLDEQRDALCGRGEDDAEYRAASDAWDASIEKIWTFWPRIVAIKATTPEGWMAKASLSISTPEQLADARADPGSYEVGNSTTSESLIMDLAEAFFAKQAEGVAHIPAAELDAPILDLWRRRQRVFGRYEASADLDDEHLNAYAARGSALAALFRPRESDFAGNAMLGRRLRVSADGFYTRASVDLLRTVAATASPLQARAAEIVAAYDGFGTQSAEHLAAAADLEKVATELHSFDAAIRDTPALSLEGIGIKASWALTTPDCAEKDRVEILRQVEAFAHRHRKPARMPDVARLEREVMGGLPAADWALYRLFVRWMQSAAECRALAAEEEAAFKEHGDDSEAWRVAEARATAASARNEALRVSIVDMPAASLQGVRLKAHVYEWLSQTAEDGVEHLLKEARKGNAADDSVLALAIARDVARMPPAACLGASTEGAPAQDTEKERAA